MIRAIGWVQLELKAILQSSRFADESTMSLEFFQRDRQQNLKGIIAINLLEWEP